MKNNDYEMAIKIRAFEELVLDLFGQNKLSGTTHTYIGEEATAVSVMKYVREQDKVFSNHRCHGHYLAYGGPEKLLLAEIMSKESGLCQGRGGSQHIHYKNFYTNGIQGGIVPNAVGMALADKINGNDSNVVVFLGDGTLGQGVIYEAFNIASIYEIPVVFVIEDNQYAMSTRRSDMIAGDIKSRIDGFNIKTYEIESTNLKDLSGFFENVFSYINSERKPVCAVVHNYRLGAHSKGDDPRDVAEIEQYRKNDPMKLIQDMIGEDAYKKIYQDFRAGFDRCVEELETEKSIVIEEKSVSSFSSEESFLAKESIRYVDRIREAFGEQLQKKSDTIFLGEDIRDPYGGAFKATKGLSVDFDTQVMNMPISEACMIGMAVGMGMNRILPVVEMMFGDFVTLGLDQILNHASKYGWVYGDDVTVPMIVRTPMGAKRGYGPTHSQSLEKFLIGIPNIKVLALSQSVDPLVLYRNVFDRIQEPTILVENKKLYGQKTWKIENNQYRDFVVKEINHYGYPTIVFSIDSDSKPDIYAITYGGLVEDVISAAEDLMMQDEIQVDVIVLTQISPLPVLDLKECISASVPVVTVEEGTKTSGIGTEIIATCIENDIGSKYRRIATPDMPIPNGIVLENQIIPNRKSIAKQIRGL